MGGYDPGTRGPAARERVSSPRRSPDARPSRGPRRAGTAGSLP
jgi:hypothetical protein